jgi:tetratricopeptide (TPR) repeat protein/tRNA A-37 threonylcarbamoyl transferase component Bud32/TolB-like protein
MLDNFEQRFRLMSLNDDVNALFEAALEREADQRAAFLTQNCPHKDVRNAVENLLATHRMAGALLTDPTLADPPEIGEAHIPSLESGTLLAGRFRIARFVAHGGMGELYEAEDLELHETLAIKTLRSEILKQPRAIERFKREVHLARRVTHSNVCRVFDLFRDRPEGKEEIVFVTMEFLRGETLAERMKRSGRLSLAESLPLIRQMASALGAAHEAGIVHRDFKPANVMLVDDSAGPRAVVTDFGLAFRGINPPGNLSVKGATWEVSSMGGALYGTLSYMAPEQIEGHEATAASDIYGLGLVIYEMVTGVRPFSGETPMAAAVKRLIEDPPAPRTHDPALNPVWDRAILRCLEREPSRRFVTAQGFLSALEGNEPRQVRTEREGRWHTSMAHRPWSRHLFAWLTGIAAIAIASFAVGIRYFSHQRARTAPQSMVASVGVSLRPAVAVLGFTNLSHKPNAEWLSTALSETLNTELALGEKLRTIPGENVARTKLALSLPDADSYGQDTLARIRTNMNTDIVVSGSYLDAGGKDGHVRIDLRAQDTRTGNTIAVISENGTEAQVLELISRTGAEVREKLGAGADTPAVDEAVRASAPSSPEVARLYSEGLKKLWLFDSVGAKANLERVVIEEPAYPLGHDALAEVWSSLGYGEKAKQEAEKAYHLSENLSREQRLSIEGHYREMNHDWGRAVELYSSLFNFFPDNLDYGLEEAKAEWHAGKGKEALRTTQMLRNLPAPVREDPRIDLAESQYAWATGDFKRSQTAAEEAERKGKNLRAPLVVATAQLNKCNALGRLGENAQAIANCEDAEKAFAQAGDRTMQAKALLNVAIPLQEQGDSTRAEIAREQALVIFKETGDKLNQALAMNNGAVVVSMQGDHRAAARTYEQVLGLLREIDNKPRMLITMSNLAQQFRAFGNLAGASTEYRQAVSLSREIGDKDSEAWATRGLGANLLLQGDLPGTERALKEAIRICQNTGEKRLLGFSFNDMGDLLEAEGKLDQAENSYKQAVDIANGIGDQEETAEPRVSLAANLLDKGRPAESEALVRQTIPVFQKAKSKDMEVWANAVLAKALLAQGKADEAARVINSVATESVDDIVIRFEFTLASALVRAASQMPEEQRAARESIKAMVAETTRGGFIGYEFEARLTLGEAEMKSNQGEAGRRTLATLEKEARNKGFAFIEARASDSHAADPIAQ